jgi:Zn-finger nucleic acid-binding protein
MNRTNYSGGSGIIVDSCQTDGIWFDRGELTAVVAFIEGGGLDKFRKREKERLREEIASLESRKRIGDGTSIPVSGTAEKIRTLETIGELVSFVGSLLRKF